MQLQHITIKNYRSIKNLTFDLNNLKDDKTFALIGNNEAGKTSFLKAISTKDGLHVVTLKDFYSDSEIVDIIFTYKLDELLKNEIYESLKANNHDLSKDKEEVNLVSLHVIYDPDNPTGNRRTIEVISYDQVIKKYIEDNFLNQIFEAAHKVIFWTAEQRYLITEPVDLVAFSANPQQISVPLHNCFLLTGINDIHKEVTKITNNPAAKSILQKKLGDKVTEHIKNVWPNHPIKISFDIDQNKISFLVEDNGVKYEAKTADQRSDGFKQFVSFLLTVSAESTNKQLQNTILLLDEPETHIHPQGQEYLLNELIKISNNNFNNIVFFATHSNFMIDKYNLRRCFKVEKSGNKDTVIEQFSRKDTTYSEVNYEVFGISTNDYHNELYGYLEDILPEKLSSLKQDADWFNTKSKKTEQVSLPKYIRNSIHHPENSKNKKPAEELLTKSIKILRELKYDNE